MTGWSYVTYATVWLVVLVGALAPQRAATTPLPRVPNSASSLLTDPGFTNPAGAVWLSPNTTQPPIFHYNLYGPLAAPPTPPPVAASSPWMVTQWNTNANLPAPASSGSGANPCRATHLRGGVQTTQPAWFTSNPRSGHLCYYTDTPLASSASSTSTPPSTPTPTLEVHQDGSHGLPCGHEFDSFLSPIGRDYVHFPTGMRGSHGLASLAWLNLTVGLTLLPGSGVVAHGCSNGTTPDCGPSGRVDYGYVTAGVVLHSNASQQTLFYQILFGDTREGRGCPGLRSACSPASPTSWYSSTNPFGANDVIASFDGAPCLGLGSPAPGTAVPVGQRHLYQINVLPALLHAIRTGPPALSRDTSAWLASGIYIGPGLEGAVQTTLLIDSVDIVEGPGAGALEGFPRES